VRERSRPAAISRNLPVKLQDCFGLLSDSVLALQRENKEILWGSMVKETMKRKKPSFNEGYYGFRTFSHLLEDAQKRGIVKLRRDQRSGSYIVEDLGDAAPTEGAGTSTAGSSTATSAEAASSGETDGARTSTRRRRSRGSRRTKATGTGESETGTGASNDGAEPAPPQETPAPPPEGEAAPATRPDRGTSFSLFSWLRRDTDGEGAEADKES
jgi:hypothetical protein